MIAQTLPWTLILVGTATIISFLLGTLLGNRRRMAARRLARPDAAGVHLPAGDALLLPGADRDRVVRGDLGPVPVRPGLQPRNRAGLELVVHLERRLPLVPARADDRAHLDGRLDAADAQRDDHDDRRGLRAGGAGQGSLAATGDVHLRGPQRDPPQPRRLRAVARLRRRRRARHGDRLLLSGHRPDALQRGHVRRLPAAAGDLPGDLAVGAGRLHARRHRVLPRRPAHADAAAPTDVRPRHPRRSRPATRKLPGRGHQGPARRAAAPPAQGQGRRGDPRPVRPDRDHRPVDRAVRSVRDALPARRCPPGRAPRTCSAPRRPARTCSRNCSSGRARRSSSAC